jgi:hypothetical protein
MIDEMVRLADKLQSVFSQVRAARAVGKITIESPLYENLDSAIHQLCIAVKARPPFDGGQMVPPAF